MAVLGLLTCARWLVPAYTYVAVAILHGMQPLTAAGRALPWDHPFSVGLNNRRLRNDDNRKQADGGFQKQTENYGAG